MTQPVDENEDVSRMEPMRIYSRSRHRDALADLALTTAETAKAFQASLPEAMVASLATLVRAMNCYYSNIIEGHNTHPIDIERALNNDYSADTKKCDLQLEAKAHIAVQSWIDEGGLRGRAATVAAISEIHRRFYEQTPESLWRVTRADGTEAGQLTPGAWRKQHVQIGRHIPVSPGAVPRFLARFQQAYAGLGRIDAILAVAAAHHRLAWIHPFLDGNGRVTRLVSHAMLLECLDGGAIWSVARGLARQEAAYKRHLAECDLPPRGGVDGSGALSEEALAGFTAFFLNACLDQIQFMQSLVQPKHLRDRILTWATTQMQRGALPEQSDRLLKSLLIDGVLTRAEIPGLLDLSDRQSRRITAALLDAGALQSDGSKAPLRLAFSAKLAPSWTPGLFPDAPST